VFSKYSDTNLKITKYAMNENCCIGIPEQVVEQPVWKDKMTRFKENRAMITCVGSTKSAGKNT
jgi:hypothetical protein